MDFEDAATARILDAAQDAIAQHGARRTTMNQIADVAGVGVATVYRRFPQKTQLVRAIVIREAARVTTEVDEAMQRNATVPEQAAAGFTAFAHAIANRPLMVRLLRGDNERDGAVVNAGELADRVMAGARDYLAAWIRALQDQGRYRAVEAEVVAEIEARLALSLVLAPEGRIPMHEDGSTRAFALRYLVPLLGPEL
jgi:TetR/AcrR family transcriptional repressor of uid operon